MNKKKKKRIIYPIIAIALILIAYIIYNSWSTAAITAESAGNKLPCLITEDVKFC